MTITCREILRDAMEEIGGLAADQEPSSPEAVRGMRRLNGLINDLAGMGIGEPLQDVEVSTDTTLLVNSRAVVTDLGAAITLTFPDTPQDGARIQVVDAENAFATHHVTLARNGRLLEGVAANITASTAGYNRTWMYRADLGDWVYFNAALDIADDLPFPADTAEVFVLLLAMRLAPGLGETLRPESTASLTRGMSRLRARYRQRIVTRADNGVLRMSRQAYGTRW